MNQESETFTQKTASTRCLVCTWCWLVAHRSLKECQEPRTTLAVEMPYQQLGLPHFWVRQPFARAAPSTGWLSGSQVGLFCNCWSQTEGVLIQRIHVNITSFTQNYIAIEVSKVLQDSRHQISVISPSCTYWNLAIPGHPKISRLRCPSMTWSSIHERVGSTHPKMWFFPIP